MDDRRGRVEHLVAVDPELTGEQVEVEPLDHGHDRQRSHLRVEPARPGRLRDPRDERADEGVEHIGAGARVLGPVGLGFGPRPYHRPVVLVDVGEATQPLTQLTVAVVGGADGCERLREARHLLGHVGRERAEQVFLVGEVQVEGAV